MVFSTIRPAWIAASLCVALLAGACAGTAEVEPAPPGTAGGEAPAPDVDVAEPVSGTADTDAPSTATEGMPADDPSGYVLGQGDIIGIQVFDEPDLTLEARVGSSGVINYSYLGDLQVAGRTPLEIERTVSRLLRDGYLVNPAVNVTVVEYRPFFINGEVRSPGGYPYQPGLTLDRAIALAGGVTDRASLRKMFVLKSAGDADEVRERVGMSYRVAPGDVISINEGFF